MATEQPDTEKPKPRGKQAAPTMKAGLAAAYRKTHPELTDEDVEVLIAEGTREIGGEEPMDEFLETITANQKRLASLPPEERVRVIDYEIEAARQKGAAPRRSEDDDIETDIIQFTKRLLALKAIAGAGDDSKPNEELMKRMNDMADELKAMREDKQAAEIKAITDNMQAQLDQIAESITASQAVPKASAIDETVKQVSEATASINAFRKMVGLPELDAKPPEPEKKLTREDAAKFLESEGWEVKGPMTPAQMAKHFDESIERVRAETRDEMKKKLKSDEKRNAMLFDLGSTFLENALPILGSTGAKKGLDVAAKALKAAGKIATE